MRVLETEICDSSLYSETRMLKMKFNKANKCLFVCVKFYLIQSRFVVVTAKCLGALLFGIVYNKYL